MGNKLKKLATNSLNAAAEATSSSSANRKDQRDEPKATPEDRQQQLKQEEDGTDNQVCVHFHVAAPFQNLSPE